MIFEVILPTTLPSLTSGFVSRCPGEECALDILAQEPQHRVIRAWQRKREPLVPTCPRAQLAAKERGSGRRARAVSWHTGLHNRQQNLVVLNVGPNSYADAAVGLQNTTHFVCAAVRSGKNCKLLLTRTASNVLPGAVSGAAGG